MVIKYQLSPYPSLMEDLVVKVWESANIDPGAEVFTLNIPQAVGGGHPNIETVTINGLDKVVHRVMLFTAISAAVLHDFNIEPLADTVEAFTPIYFKVGVGGNIIPPNAGDTFFGDGRIGALTVDDYTVFRNNYGYYLPDIHFTHIPTAGLIAGGFELIPPDQFQDGDEFMIQRKPIFKVAVNDSVVGKWFKNMIDVGINRVYSPTDLRCLLRFDNGAKYSFNGAIPVNYGFCFQNFGLSQTTSKIEFNNAPLLWGNTTKTEIDIPAFSEGAFVFDGTHWNVIYMSQSNWSNAASPITPGSNIAIGTVLLGNVPVGDFAVDVTHNKNIAGDYLVFLSCQGAAATLGKDDDLQLAWHHHATDKPNKFRLGYGIPNGSVGHNITVCYLLVKV